MVQQKELKKEFQEEKDKIEEKVKSTTAVELEVVGKVVVEEESPSFLTRLTRRVKQMLGSGEEVEIDEEYDESLASAELAKAEELAREVEKKDIVM